MKIIQYLFLMLPFSISVVSFAQTKDPIKLSKSGVCHAPATTYYEQTKRFTAYKSLNECLKAGGRLPKRQRA
jgi:hypothetical protein